MARRIEIVNPLETRSWDDWLRDQTDAGFFHTSSWAQVLSRAYGFTLRYFALLDGNRPDSLIAIADVRSRLTGRRGVGLPFTDYCPPLAGDPSPLAELCSTLIEHGRQAGWRYVEVRGDLHLGDAVPSACHFHRHVLDLDRPAAAVFASFKDANRRNIRKAQREGVEFEISGSREALWTFHRMYCDTRRRHGLPPPPRRFFRAFHELVIAPGHGRIALARYRGRAVAGAVFVRFGDKALYKYGGSDAAYQHVRAANLLFWEAIRFYQEAGCRTLCFGRTEPFNEGLRRFKLSWGTREERLEYYRYDLRRDAFVEAPLAFQGWHNAVFSRLPMPLLELAGAALYRHVA